MSIVTKTGDHGETSLYSLERVSKSHLRIEAVGTLDELNAHLAGLGLEEIQRRLFELGAILADTRHAEDNSTFEAELTALENHLFDLEPTLPPLQNFILPGGTPQAIRTHEARAICRRAERIISQIAPLPKNVLPYLNRLSDFLFIAARKFNHDAGVEEVVWNSKT
jgi:cob(I)alamin adenosyltransferase